MSGTNPTLLLLSGMVLLAATSSIGVWMGRTRAGYQDSGSPLLDALAPVHRSAVLRVLADAGWGALLTAVGVAAGLFLLAEVPLGVRLGEAREQLTQVVDGGDWVGLLAPCVAAVALLWAFWVRLRALSRQRNDWLRCVRDLQDLSDRDPLPPHVQRVCRRLAWCSDGELFVEVGPVLGCANRDLSLAHGWLYMLRTLGPGDHDRVSARRRAILEFLRHEATRLVRRARARQRPILQARRVRRAFGSSAGSVLALMVSLSTCSVVALAIAALLRA